MEDKKKDDLNETVIKPAGNWITINFEEIWNYREMIGMLVKRDVQGKYRQSVLGYSWAFIPPVMQMIVFTFIFGKVAKLGPDNIPYPIFSYAALLPWNFFSRALHGAAGSLLASKSIFTKVYFPRMILPLTGVASALVDFVLASSVMVLLMVWYRIVPGWEIITLPFFILIAIYF